MLARTRSGAVYGVAAALVEIEVSIAPGGNGDFQIVGLPDAAIRESRARIQAAIRNSGFETPFRKITVNLAPASLRKEGVGFDLPMAVGILAARGLVDRDLSRHLIAGELSLDGKIRPIRGGLLVALLAREEGIPNVILPAENAKEAALAEGVSVYGIGTLAQVVELIRGSGSFEPCMRRPLAEAVAVPRNAEDFAEVQGQLHARRALEVAAAGGHNVLMVGPPGSGKSMLARRIPTIMPTMTAEEVIETTRIHSARGLVPPAGVVAQRPFRAPHHTVSITGMVGGGSWPRPGEISLAHNGVLFLDELPEFPRHILEALRQPLEEGRIILTRSQISLAFPASLTLVGAMNPCRCGYLGDPRRECTCTPKQVQTYRSRISGPLLDRIDIQIEVPAVKYSELSGEGDSESSASIQERVTRARRIQLDRFARLGIASNARMRPADLRQWCPLDRASEGLLEQAMTRMEISARGWARILKVARTIADLDGEEDIQAPHVAEAVGYRRRENP